MLILTYSYSSANPPNIGGRPAKIQPLHPGRHQPAPHQSLALQRMPDYRQSVINPRHPPTSQAVKFRGSTKRTWKSRQRRRRIPSSAVNPVKESSEKFRAPQALPSIVRKSTATKPIPTSLCASAAKSTSKGISSLFQPVPASWAFEVSQLYFMF